MRRKSARLLAVLTAGTMLIAACSSDSDNTDSTTAATTGETTAATTGETTAATTGDTTAETVVETTEPAAAGWAVNTDDCIDPAAAEEIIEGTIKIGKCGC